MSEAQLVFAILIAFVGGTGIGLMLGYVRGWNAATRFYEKIRERWQP